MKRRWIIRAFFIALLLLCVGGWAATPYKALKFWVWSRQHEFSVFFVKAEIRLSVEQRDKSSAGWNVKYGPTEWAESPKYDWVLILKRKRGPQWLGFLWFALSNP